MIMCEVDKSSMVNYAYKANFSFLLYLCQHMLEMKVICLRAKLWGKDTTNVVVP